MPPSILLVSSAFAVIFEIIQLIVADRYFGAKKTSEGMDLIEDGPSERVAFIWSSAIIFYLLWMLVALFSPTARIQISLMLLISLVGGATRRVCGLKHLMRLLTIEGTLRMLLLIYLIRETWNALY